MTEIQEVLKFMRSGKRKEILLTDYLNLQRKKEEWSKKREKTLLREIHMSKILKVDYDTSRGLKTLLVLKDKN